MTKRALAWIAAEEVDSCQSRSSAMRKVGGELDHDCKPELLNHEDINESTP